MLYHITPLQNVPSIMREGPAPRIGKASLQAGEKEPCVYLFTSKKVVLEAVETWYSDIYPDCDLALLAVDATIKQLDATRYGGEVLVRQTIPPAMIRAMESDTLSPALHWYFG